jgi:hypothetical protein
MFGTLFPGFVWQCSSGHFDGPGAAHTRLAVSICTGIVSRSGPAKHQSGRALVLRNRLTHVSLPQTPGTCINTALFPLFRFWTGGTDFGVRLLFLAESLRLVETDAAHLAACPIVRVAPSCRGRRLRLGISALPHSNR